MKTNNKTLAKVLLDMSSGDQPKQFLVIDDDAKKEGVVVLSKESAGKAVPEDSAKMVATSPPDRAKGDTKEDEGGMAAVTPTTNNLKSPPKVTTGPNKDNKGGRGSRHSPSEEHHQ